MSALSTHFNRHRLLHFSLVILFSPLTWGETRTFTDTRGRTMTVELIHATGTTMIVKLHDGQEAEVLLSKLSKDDQLFVEKWAESHPKEIAAQIEKRENAKRSAEIPKKIVAFCKANLRKQVGNGECWTLANEAFKACGLRRPGSDLRVWGRLIDLETEDLEAGDIVEYQKVGFADGSRTGPFHTSVVVKGGTRGKAIIAEQNWGQKTVRESPFDINDVVSGKIMVYRPDYSQKPRQN